MQIVIKILVWSAFALSAIACNREVSADTWVGSYLYEHELGVGSGGVVSFVEYELVLQKKGQCKLAVLGRQVAEEIHCMLKPLKNSAVAIQFKSYSGGRTMNADGVSIYKVNQRLFSLSKTPDSLTTKWQGLQPDGIPSQSGEFFKKL